VVNLIVYLLAIIAISVSLGFTIGCKIGNRRS